MAYQGGYAQGYEDAAAAEVTFAGTGTFTAAGTVELSATVAFAGTGTFSAAAIGEIAAAVAFAGVGTFTVQSDAATVTFAGAGAFTATSTVAFSTGSVRFAGGSTFSIAGTAAASVSFNGTGTVTVSVALDYRVDVVDMNGSLYGTLTNARLGKYSFELNGHGSADFTLATTDPDAVYVRPGREIQIWRNGVLQWWGPIVRPQAGLRTSTWQCAGLGWYFDHRFMGRADRVNLLTNGDFEAGETGWTFSGGGSHAVDTAIKVEGTQSLLLGGATADHVQYATQTTGAYSQSHPLGDYLTIACWVWVPSSTYLGGAFEDRGLVAIRWSGGTAVDVQVATIDDTTPRDQWIPLEVGIPSVSSGDTIEVRLYPPHGTAYFDLVTLTAMESLSFGYPGPVDVATIVAGIVAYAQDRAPYGYFGHNKSDLNIGTAGVPTGVLQSRAYQFAEHRNVADAILEFVRGGVLDIGIETTATTRTFTTYAPSKGTLFGTRLELDVNVADFTYSWDGENAASSVVVLGPGDGPDRPEGGASDLTFLDGLTLEIVESAADDATVGELDTQAAERLTVAATPEIVELTTLPHVGIIGNLTVGDTVPVRIAHGWVNIDSVYRVAHMVVDPYKDQATLTLNPV